MTITETTPPPAPIERTFTLSLTENEMKLLCLTVGNTSGDELRMYGIRTPTSELQSAKFDINFIEDTYDILLNAISK